MSLLRQLRGALGVATTWGVAFAALGLTILIGGRVTGLFPDLMLGARYTAAVLVRLFIAGGVAGTVFSVILASAERRKSVTDLSPRRAAMWGFIGGAVMPWAFVAITPAGISIPWAFIGIGSVAYGLLAGGIGAATVRIARRGAAPEIAGAPDPLPLPPR